MGNGTPSGIESAFESASELRKEHEKLLERLDDALGPEATAADEDKAIAGLEKEVQLFLERGVAAGVFLEEIRQRTSCQVLLDFWVSTLARTGRPAPRSRLTAFDATQLPSLEDVPCPYVGLEAFHDSKYFFGRSADTKRLVEQIVMTPLVVVLGASGSGKSSLVLGGAIPTLKRSNANLRFADPIVPGDAALQRFADALRSLRNGSSGGAAPNASTDDLPTVIRDLGAPPVVVVIDQFEEVFTLNKPEDQRRLTAHLAALLGTGVGHRVLLTMREEFRSRLVELEALQPYLENPKLYSYSMEPMNSEQLREAILGPADEVNLQFQTGLADKLARDVLGQPAALPLLQFALQELWDGKDRNRITREVYDEVGRPIKALQRSADAFYDSRTRQDKDEIERILLELVRVDELLEAYRQPVKMVDLLAAGRANTPAVLELLEDNDYIRITPGATADDAVVEVKHEALIRNWPTYKGWIDEKRLQERRRLQLSEAARRWEKEGNKEDLLTGWALEEAKKLPDLSPTENAFVEASVAALDAARREREAAEEHRRRLEEEARLERERAEGRRRTLRWAWRFLAILAVALALAVVQWVRADRAEAKAKRAESDAVKAREETLRANARLKDALVTANRERAKAEEAEDEARQWAFETGIAEWEAEQQRLEAVNAQMIAEAALEGESKALEERGVALDQARAAASEANRLRSREAGLRFDAETQRDNAIRAKQAEERERRHSVALQVAAQAVQLEPVLEAERALAAMLALQAHRVLVENGGDPQDQTAFRALWKTFTWLGRKWDTTLELETAVRALATSPSGTRFAVGTAGGEVYLFDSWKTVVDKRLALEKDSASALTRTRLFQLFLNARRVLVFEDAEVRSLDISSADRYLAAGSSSGEIRILDLVGDTSSRKRGREKKISHGDTTELKRQVGSVDAISFSPDGRLLATGGAGGLQIWHQPAGTWESAASQTDLEARSLAFSPSGERLAVGTERGVRVLFRTGAGPWTQLGLEQRWERLGLKEKDTICDTRSLFFAGASTVFAGCRQDGRIQRISLDGQQVPAFGRGHDSPLTSLSHRAGRLASASLDGTVRLWANPSAPIGGELPIVFDDPEGWVWSVSFHPEDDHEDGALLAGSADRTVRRFLTRSDDLVNKICARLEELRKRREGTQKPDGPQVEGDDALETGLSARQWERYFHGAVEYLQEDKQWSSVCPDDG